MPWAIDPQMEGVLGAFGTLAALALFAAPYTTFSRIVASKSTEEFSPFPYVSALLNCSVGAFYGLPFITPQRTSLLVTNLIGIVFQTVYLAIFTAHARDKPRQYVLQLLGSYATFMALLVILVTGVLPPESRSSTVGYCMVAFTVIMFGAPMASLSVVLRTRSVEYMPLPLSLMGLACSTAWALYGTYVQDAMVVAWSAKATLFARQSEEVWRPLPNALGMALGVVQLAIYAHIRVQGRKKSAYSGLDTSEDMEGKPASIELMTDTSHADNGSINHMETKRRVVAP